MPGAALGDLAVVVGDVAAAQQHYRRAIEVSTVMQASGWEAHARRRLADLPAS